jgi:hypothetical protein
MPPKLRFLVLLEMSHQGVIFKISHILVAWEDFVVNGESNAFFQPTLIFGEHNRHRKAGSRVTIV